MAAPKLVRTIGVKAPDLSIGEYVTIKNLSRGGQLIQKVDGTDRSTVFNPAPSLEWQDGDIVHAEVHGRVNGYTRTKISSGGSLITISASADTTTPGVAL